MGSLSLAAAVDMACRAFEAAGVARGEAQVAAEALARAEAMGIGTHGLRRVADYVGRIRAGGIDPKASVEVAHLAPALCRVNGNGGLGPVVAHRALEAAMAAAEKAGIAGAFVHGGSHLGALAPYLYRAAEAGFAAIIVSNTAPMIAPAGGRAPRIGNSPLGLAIPHPGGRHVLLDIAMTQVARSKVRAAERAGSPIPANWATDPEGRPTTDPSQAMAGMMRAIGGDKGANLALTLDLMVSGLSGASFLSEIASGIEKPEVRGNLGYMMVAVDAERLLPADQRTERLEAASRIIRETPAMDTDAPPRLPGERALAALALARTEGLSLDDRLVRELRALAG